MQSSVNRSITAVLLAASILTPSVPALGAPSHTAAAAQFVDELGASAVGVLDETEGDSANRDARLRAIFSQAFGVQAMARVVVERSWQTIAPGDRERFYELFGVFMLDNTVRLLNSHEPDLFEVTETRMLMDGTVVVTTDVSRFGIKIAHIDWIVRGADSDFRVIDIVLNRVSTVRTYQAEFDSVIRREGFDALMAALQSKNAR